MFSCHSALQGTASQAKPRASGAQRSGVICQNMPCTQASSWARAPDMTDRFFLLCKDWGFYTALLSVQRYLDTSCFSSACIIQILNTCDTIWVDVNWSTSIGVPWACWLQTERSGETTLVIQSSYLLPLTGHSPQRTSNVWEQPFKLNANTLHPFARYTKHRDCWHTNSSELKGGSHSSAQELVGLRWDTGSQLPVASL